MLEANIRDFSGNWTGTGAILSSGDDENAELCASEYMISEVVNTGQYQVTLYQNLYDPLGDDADLDYRHGTTPGNCQSAGWNDYTVPFMSLGYIQVRIQNL